MFYQTLKGFVGIQRESGVFSGFETEVSRQFQMNCSGLKGCGLQTKEFYNFLKDTKMLLFARNFCVKTS